MFEKLLAAESSWEQLKNSSLPVAVYGTGNGADRVFAEFERLGIAPSAVIASDGFVRNREFHGFRVKSVSQLENELGDFTVAVAFAGGIPEVVSGVRALAGRHRVIMPSVPVWGDSIFNKDFLKAHSAELEAAYSLLADGQSRAVFESIVDFQITGDLSVIASCESEADEAFELLDLGADESFLDLGAYRGDTVQDFLGRVKKYKKITAVEPNEKTFKKLKTACASLKNCCLVNKAVWFEDCTLSFNGEAGRGGSIGGDTPIEAVCIDSLASQFGDFTYIKCDCEGAEREALAGGAGLISRKKPKLCIAAYHRSEDIFALANQIHSLNGEYKIYLRHHPHLTLWDTNLYCI